MPGESQLSEVTDGASFLVKPGRWNEVVRALNALQREVNALAQAGRVPPPRCSVYRMQVTEAPGDTYPTVLLAKRYDGTVAIDPEYPVRWRRTTTVGAEFLACLPAGGTDAEYNGAAVVLEELRDTPLLARITGVSGTGPRMYAFTEVEETPGGGYADKSGGLTGSGAVNGSDDTGEVPTDGSVVVQMRVGTDTAGNPAYRFGYESVPLGAVFRVDLDEDGGSDGNKTTAASWTYTVTTIDESATVLGTGLSPEWPRPLGRMTAATMGQGYFDADGAFVLTVAYEYPGTSACPAAP